MKAIAGFQHHMEAAAVAVWDDPTCIIITIPPIPQQHVDNHLLNITPRRHILLFFSYNFSCYLVLSQRLYPTFTTLQPLLLRHIGRGNYY